MKLYELNDKAKQSKISVSEKLFSLLVHIYDEEGLECRVLVEDTVLEPGILYMLEDHMKYSFDLNYCPVIPLSMFVNLELAPKLIDSINRYGIFKAEMYECNFNTHRAHIVVHAAIKFEQLEALTRWGERNRTIRPPQKNIVNKQYKSNEEKIKQALSDYSSGQFQYKKEVAKKHQIPAPTLTRHAYLNRVEFIKKIL